MLIREILDGERFEVAQAINRYRGYLAWCESAGEEVEWVGPFLSGAYGDIAAGMRNQFPQAIDTTDYEDGSGWDTIYWFNESDLVEWLGGEDYMTMHTEDRKISRLTDRLGWDEDMMMWEMAYNDDDREFEDPDEIPWVTGV